MAKMKKRMSNAKKGILSTTKKPTHVQHTKKKTKNVNSKNNATSNIKKNAEKKYGNTTTSNNSSGQTKKYNNNSKEKFKKKKVDASSDDDDDDDQFEVVDGNDKIEKEGTLSMTDVDIGQNLTSIDTADTRQMVKAQNRKHKKSGGFQAMGLSHNVFKGITRKGYKLPTPIQRKTVPLIMDGKDVVAMARTGSGKTAAFLIPMFEKLQAHSTNGARAVILSPTRELALQTMKFTKELGKYMDLKTSLILGGDSMENQFAELHQNPDILIATPGRFLHILVEMDIKRLDNIEYIVFDEADRLFEMGFSEQLHEIIRRVPESRQTLLFSATLPKVLVDFTSAGLSDPTLIRLDVDTKISEKLKMAFFMLRPEDKIGCLLHLLQSKINSKEQTLIFVSTKHHVEFLQELLSKAGISCSYIYSSLDQTARKIHLAKFRKKLAMVLIVTDIAARGIDIPMLDNVVNFDFPSKPKIFVHRVGRVARAGRSGMAYSMVVKDELAFVLDLHLFLGRPLKMADDSSNEDADGILGTIQQSTIATEVEFTNELSTADFNLHSMKKVMENGYIGYIRTREAASDESIRRSKEMNQMVIQAHPLFRGGENGNENLTKLLYDLQKFKPKVTVFESMNTKKSKGTEAIMKEKRKYHTVVIERTKQKVKEKEKETENKKNNVKTSVTDEQYVAETFHTKNYKDAENFIPRQSSDFHGERGFTVKSFEKDAKSVSVDVNADDGSQMKQNQNAKKWDRKRKKFVSVGGSNVKKMKTESGNYINASYKSNRYSDWVKQNNMTAAGAKNGGDDGSDNDENNGGSNSKRFLHTRGKAMFKGGRGGGMKRKGALKSKEEIVKNRLKAEREKSWLRKKGERGGGGRGRGRGRGGGRGGRR